MSRLLLAAFVLLTSVAAAQPAPVRLLAAADAATITTYYRQNLYDAGDRKIGQIVDLLVDKDGQIQVAMVSVGGFLGIVGGKTVAIAFDGLQVLERDRKPFLVADTSMRELRDAPAFKYNRSSRRWKRVEE